MSSLSAKQRRHQAILELVRGQPLGSQDELRRALAGRGQRVTQSTLSRDLKELRIARVPEEDGYRYVAARDKEKLRTNDALDIGGITAAEVVAVEANEVTVVLRTRVGRAQGVAVYLDRHRPAGVLATVAGDDTVLVVPESIEGVEDLTARLARLFGSSVAQD